jgi:hypothetical protein
MSASMIMTICTFLTIQTSDLDYGVSREYFISSINQDTLLLKTNSAGFIFLVRGKEKQAILIDKKLYEYENIDSVYVKDLNNDTKQEILILFGDEGFYSIRIYSVSLDRDDFVVKEVFQKDNIDNPPFNTASGDFVEFRKMKSEVYDMVFYTNVRGINSTFRVKYDAKRKRYYEFRTDQ